MSLRVQLLIEVGPEHSNHGVITHEPSTCCLDLGTTLVRYREDTRYEVTLDFESRRRIVFDADSGRVDNNALLTTLGFRTAGLLRRASIAGVLKAGGASPHGFGPVFAEHQMAVLDPGRHTTMTPAGPVAATGFGATIKGILPRRPAFDIDVATRYPDVTYWHAGQLLVAHSTRGIDVTPEYVRAFVQFIRYRFGGHPLVLDRLASQKRIPEALRLHALLPTNLDDGAVSIRVAEACEIAGEPPSRHGAPAIFDQQEPIDSILLEQYSCDFRDDRPPPGTRLDDAVAVARQGRIFEALLAFIALSLEQPVSIPSELAGAVKTSPDPRIATVVGPQPRNADEARARADALATLRAEVNAHAETLLANEAAYRVRLKEGERAKELYVDALKLNPRLVGAYKDLGDYYLSVSRADRAWRCWDAARRIAPSHPMLRDVNELEQRLVAEHPEYVRM